jgi:hypothetical protein
MQNAHEFVAELNKQFEAAHPDNLYRPIFYVKCGPVYDKVCSHSAERSETDGGSVYCFINASGEIFKAASFKAPAKGVRARLSDITPEFCAKIASAGYATTAWLYR